MCTFIEGQKVLVSNGSEKLNKRIFVDYADDGRVMTVHAKDEEAYQNGEYFRVGVWSVAEEYTPEYGDEVEVSNGGEKFQTRIFLGYSNDKVLVVHNSDTEKFKSGAKNFKTALWNMMKD